MPEELSNIGFVLGLAFIIVSLSSRFNTVLDSSVPPQFRVFKLSDLTATPKYLFGIVLYFFLLLLLYALLSLATQSREVVSALQLDSFGIGTDPISSTLTVALILAGILPNIPFFDRLEHFLRHAGQRLAGIPTDHSHIFEKIQSSKIHTDIKKSDIGVSLTDNQEARIEELIGTSSMQDYLKTRLIISKLTGGGAGTLKDPEIRNKVRNRFDNILDALTIKSIKTDDQLKSLSRQSVEKIEADDVAAVSDDIEAIFRATSYMLGCAIVASPNNLSQKVNKALRDFGLVPRSEMINSDLVEQMWRSLFFGFLGFFFTCICFYYFRLATAENITTLLPSSLLNCITLTIQFYIPTAICLSIFLSVRRFFIEHGFWYLKANTPKIFPSILAIGLACASLVSVPILDLFLRIIEIGASASWSFWVSPRTYLGQNLILFSYPITFLLFVIVFIEFERKASQDKAFRIKLYERRVVAFRMSLLFFLALSISLAFANESVRSLFSGSNIWDFPYYCSFLIVHCLMVSGVFCLTFAFGVIGGKKVYVERMPRTASGPREE